MFFIPFFMNKKEEETLSSSFLCLIFHLILSYGVNMQSK
ncbi:hypothetical protein FH5_00764 [Priestia endophytica]|nr:hypothetical protein FH5_00764 [Priestia endophytica]